MDTLPLKKLSWVLSSRRALQDFPKEARSRAGSALMAIQLGELPPDWKSMPSIGPGAMELRIHEPHEHRVIYVAKFADVIYVLHCFEKKTRATSPNDLKQARKAYAQMQQERRK
ncbi:type II toxin-antitoxin system RelE/ParE family toxin [bacterium]|nr:type II toxin-antitoxin system RelE/ParE family toxin [bacterium]